MAVVHSIGFTPLVDCTVKISATFDAQKTFGSDWASTSYAQLFCTQGATVVGDAQPLSTSRARYTIQFNFSVVAGVAATFGLQTVLSSPTTLSFWNIELLPEEIRR